MDTYSVVIVDDDSLARSQLKYIIDWEREGCSIKGEATNGKDAQKIILEIHPDIIITDMNMPIIDGIELIRWISENAPGSAVIAVSGYEDFTYVKSSLRGGALDYILKHQMSEKVIKSVLKTAKDYLASIERTKREKYHSDLFLAQKKIEKQKSILSSLCLNENLTVPTDLELVDAGFVNKLSNSMMIVVDLEVDLSKDGLGQLKLQKTHQVLNDIFNNILNQFDTAYFTMVNETQAIIAISHGGAYSLLMLYNDTYSLIQRLRTSMKRYLNLTASYAVSNIITKPKDLSKNYKILSGYFEQRFTLGKDRIYMADDIKQLSTQMITLSLEDERSIVVSLKNNNKEAVFSLLDVVFGRMKLERSSRSSVMIVSRDLLRILINQLKSNKMDSEDFFGDIDPYRILEEKDSLIKLTDWIKQLFDQYFSYKEDELVENFSLSVKEVISFIRHHYNEDISLNTISEKIGVSVAHLSRLFKDECGMNYVKYLNEYRIERAKELLKENNSFKDVAIRSGFNHYNYFFKVFKDYTGMTPHEYIVNIKNDE